MLGVLFHYVSATGIRPPLMHCLPLHSTRLHRAFLIMPFDYRTATIEEFSQFCSRRNVERSVISEVAGGHSVIKIANEAIIKCGANVTQQEAENQRNAFELID
jgi:hypothetical protein